jgi:thiol-disulfide isomerase/thioredoxin
MKRLVLALVTVALAVSACTSAGSNGTYRFTSATSLGKLIPQADRKPAGTFSGELIDGGTIGSSALNGKVAVLNFWASWCTPCRIESPQLDIVYRRLKGKGVAFLGIDTKDAKGNARSFVRDFDISYPIVFDENGEIAIRLGDLPARGLPFTVLLDKSGDVAAVYLGELTAKDLQGPLDTLRSERQTA